MDKPELLESIAAALGVSVNALKDYGVETAGDLMSLLVRLEDSFGIVPSADGSGLSLDRTARERRDRRRRVRGLESLAVTAPRISQSTQPNQDARLGGELRSLLRKLSFYSPLHAKAFQA